MRRTIVISALLLIFCVLLPAQEVIPGGKVDVGMPGVLKGNEEGTYKLTDIEKELNLTNKWGQNKKRSNKYWRVWSDRDNNIVYNDTGKNSEAKRKLNFGEPVIIGFIKNDMALVYTDDETEDSKWPFISAHPKQIGWIPMDNLLLWDRCPTDDNYVQKKAVIAIHLNELKSNTGNYRYTSPDKESGMQALTMDMNFYFIMKIEGRRALLCLNPSVDRGGGNLFGWVEKDFYASWDQRACLEANWDLDYVDHWKNKEVGVYRDPNLSSGSRLTFKYGSKENGDPVTAYKYRWDPNFLRFPIIKPVKDKADWANCTAFADPKTGKIGEFDGEAASSIDTLRKEKRQMNIIYVIEASNDMGEYLEAVKASLDKLNGYSAKNLKVKTGLVLYRSEASGNSAIEIAKLDETDDPRFLSMLSAGKANGKFSGSTRTVALRQAIETAINPAKMGFTEKQSTMLVLVGNRGDNLELADETILKKLKRNHIQLMSIQVVNSENGSPAIYEDQVKEMIIRNMKNQYGSIGTKDISKKGIGNDGYIFSSSKTEESVFFSCVLYPSDINEKYTGERVTNWINNGVRWFSETIDRWSKKFEKDISETGNTNNYSKFLEEFLGTETYERIKKIGGIHAYDGYVPLKDSEGGNYWRYIIYMSRDEFAQLLQNLKPTYEAAMERNDERDKYREAVRALVKNMTGQNDDKQIDNMSVNDLQRLIYGLNIPMGFTKRTLNEITDKSKVQRGEYVRILEKFADKYEKLKDIFDQDYRYKAEFGVDVGEYKNKNTYYWIPVDRLPLNED